MQLRRIITVLMAMGVLTAGILMQTMSAAYASPSASRATGSRVSNSAGSISPNVKWADCSGSTEDPTWVHTVLFDPTQPGTADYCYGFTGTWKIAYTNWSLAYFCAGNNKGSFTYYQRGATHSKSFSPGQKFNFYSGAVTQLKSISITGWSGSDSAIPCNLRAPGHSGRWSMPRAAPPPVLHARSAPRPSGTRQSLEVRL
jgi:hypothetical protein